MATIQGIPNPTAGEYIEVSRAYDNNGSGRVIQLVFRGDKNTLRIASAQWVALGAKYSIREDGPYSEATVTIGGNSFDPGLPIQDQTTPQVGELADIRYEFRTDYLDVSVFALPAVDKEANSTGNPALYRYIIETAIKNGERLPGIQESNISTLPLAQKVWQMLYRGQDTFPTARVSLTRIATFSGNLGLPQVPNSFFGGLNASYDTHRPNYRPGLGARRDGLGLEADKLLDQPDHQDQPGRAGDRLDFCPLRHIGLPLLLTSTNTPLWQTKFK